MITILNYIFVINTKIEQAKKKYFENISQSSNKKLNTKKSWSLLKVVMKGRHTSNLP